MKSFLIYLFFLPLLISGQTTDFQVILEPVEFEGLGGLQSYAYGTSEGKWLIIGGRLDGLHERQPFASFDEAGNNNQVIVVDPQSGEIRTRSIEGLDTDIREQFASTNMQFRQRGSYLYLTGGYAYSPSYDEHLTFPFITRIDLEKCIQAIIDGDDISNTIIQKTGNYFALTGGRMELIDEVFYLVGGQKFTGRYNPQGPDHGPGFEQEYSFEVRPFEIMDTEDDFNFNTLEVIHDEIHLRRRDYNLLPQIDDGKEELMIFSGVFQKDVDLPFLYPVRVDTDSYEPIENFTQYFNHYHCANLPVYLTEENEMHNLFFGGIAQFYLENEILVQDNNVPFVKTIADIARTKNGTFTEKTLSSEMPGYFGAGSEFIRLDNDIYYKNGVLKGETIGTEPTFVGYIYGGIESSGKNIFWINDGTQSTATPVIFKVYLKKTQLTSTSTTLSEEPRILIFPNPGNGFFRIVFYNEYADEINVTLYNSTGQKLEEIYRDSLAPGPNYFSLRNNDLTNGSYWLRFKVKDNEYVRQVIVDE